jgi:hypothetical protein
MQPRETMSEAAAESEKEKLDQHGSVLWKFRETVYCCSGEL